ncbi:MAG: TetR/AcrR family transcriptional regulator [Pseudomonadota bacterium]
MTEAAEAPPVDLVDATRYEILRHAEDLFGHYGFSKTTMADIAGRCGMSTGNLYRYYRNKQAIGIAVVEQFFRQAEAAMEASVTGMTDPETRIRAVLSASLKQMMGEMSRNPKLMELVEWLHIEDEAWVAVFAHISWKRDFIVRELERGIASGRFSEANTYETAVNLMHATKAFQVPQTLTSWRQPETILPELEGVLDLVFKGVRAKKS